MPCDVASIVLGVCGSVMVLTAIAADLWYYRRVQQLKLYREDLRLGVEQKLREFYADPTNPKWHEDAAPPQVH